MSNAQIKSLNFAVISSFKKIFDVSCTDVAVDCVECMKMFYCCEEEIEIFTEKHSVWQYCLFGM